MKKFWYIILFIIFGVLLQMHIINNFENFGRTDTGGGFVPYGFGVWISYTWILLIAVIIVIVGKSIFNIKIKLKKVILFLFLMSIIIWYINKVLFIGGPLSHIAQGDFDNDGLPNTYEDKIGTNKYSYNNKEHTYVLDEIIPTNSPPKVEKVIVKITGREDYSNVMAADINERYAQYFMYPLGIKISNFGHYLPGQGVKFDYIEVEIYMKDYESFKDYRPGIYIRNNSEDIILEEINHLTEETQKKYIVKIPFDYYLRDNIYRYNDDIVLGLIYDQYTKLIYTD